VRPRALLLVFAAISSVQFGAALARTLFDEAGPAGTVFLRVAFAAVILALLWRPTLRGHSGSEWRLVAAFGLALAGMNFFFYESIDRIPLGLAVTFEFVGPLAVAVAGSRRALDFLWVVLAGAGIVLLASKQSGGGLDALGVVLAFLAGGCWAVYILMSARTGRVFPRGSGLALAMCIGAVVLIPAGAAAGGALVDGHVLLIGLGVAVLSSVIPYSAEFEALRLLPEHVFGVLMSAEPAMASLAGFLVLHQSLGLRDLGGIALVTAAVAGAVSGTRAPVPRDA
jgi:inner membrane transporter RhtA